MIDNNHKQENAQNQNKVKQLKNPGNPFQVNIQPIPLLTLESQIKRELRTHFRKLGFTKDKNGMLIPPANTKESFRALHQMQRLERLKEEKYFIEKNVSRLLPYFANGKEVIPEHISPRLQLIETDTVEANLFRLASLTWSIPVSRGFGRRMRFLVWDDNNNKLIGIMALGDPVFNLRVRDEKVGWTLEQRNERLVNIMDAYVLGALPPYNMLLGGKLVACLIRTQEVFNFFCNRYKNTTGIISGKQKHAILSMITTTSALGKSAIYNRLTLNGVKYFESIGYTSGWGHFHIPEDIFIKMRHLLEIKGHQYFNNYEFGNGPNWRLRTAKAAMQMLGIKPDLLKHGLSREVFICKMGLNTEDFLRGDSNDFHPAKLLSVNEVSKLAIERWIIPRSKRYPDFKSWSNENLLNIIDSEQNISLINNREFDLVKNINKG